MSNLRRRTVDGYSLDPWLLGGMNTVLLDRGPDSSLSPHGRTGLAMRRLSIINHLWGLRMFSFWREPDVIRPVPPPMR